MSHVLNNLTDLGNIGERWEWCGRCGICGGGLREPMEEWSKKPTQGIFRFWFRKPPAILSLNDVGVMVVLRCLCTFHTLCREVFSVVNLDIWNGKGRRKLISALPRYRLVQLSQQDRRSGPSSSWYKYLTEFLDLGLFLSTDFVEVSGTFGHLPIGGGQESEGK
jgi:hypothetical protein